MKKLSEKQEKEWEYDITHFLKAHKENLESEETLFWAKYILEKYRYNRS